MSSPSTPSKSTTSSSPSTSSCITTTSTISTTLSTPSATSTPTRTTTPSSSSQSHYQTLIIPITASQSEIRAAFHSHCKMARTSGPTYIPSFHSSARYVQLKEAYDMLSDRDDKKKYDIMRAQAGDEEIGERLKREAEEMERQWEEVKKVVEEGKGFGMGMGMGERGNGGEDLEAHMRGIEERKEERRREQMEWEEQRVLYVYEGVGEEVVRKWKGRPRGPRVKGTNV